MPREDPTSDPIARLEQEGAPSGLGEQPACRQARGAGAYDERIVIDRGVRRGRVHGRRHSP
jgi:hypothetical protein